MFSHYITGPPQREEILRERKIKRFLNFIFEVCHNEVFFKLQDQLNFKTFQEFHSFLLISLLTKIIFRLSQNNKQAKINFLNVVNYILRHKTITLILVIHNLLSNNLSNDILCAHHVFLSYSNLRYLIMR